MKAQTASVLAWSVAVLFLTAAALYVLCSETPPNVITRVEFVLLAAAVLGIPLGIRFGTQEKFWT